MDHNPKFGTPNEKDPSTFLSNFLPKEIGSGYGHSLYHNFCLVLSYGKTSSGQLEKKADIASAI